MTDMFFAGLDLGSTMTKVVIIDNNEKIWASEITHTGAAHRRLANKVMEKALEKAGLSFNSLALVIATGYGRMSVPFADKQISELSCHARGVVHFLPTVRLAIDIGGQDAKGLKIKDGKLEDFVMNDKCAAGTGRFLEILSNFIGIGLNELGPISMKATDKCSCNNVCTVFAQQEIISHLSDGIPIEDIVAGLHEAIAMRTVRMVRRIGIEPDICFTGGVAKNCGIVKAFEESLGFPVFVPENPLLSGAIGAALLGKEIVMNNGEKDVTIKRPDRHLEAVSFFK